MFSVKVETKSDNKKFNSYVKSAVSASLIEMGVSGVANIKSLTPVDSGNLKASNRYDIDFNTLIFSNNMEYAPYIEFGTRYISPQSFMRRGINNSRRIFNQIIKKRLSV